MLQAIKELGEYSLSKKGADISNTVSILTEKPSKVEQVLTIKFNEQKQYTDVELSEFDSQDYSKYLYKKGPSSGTYPGPSIILQTRQGKDWKVQSWQKKFMAWFEKHQKGVPLLKGLFAELKQKEEVILSQISTIIDPNKISLLYLTIDNKDLLDVKEIVDVFLSESQKGFKEFSKLDQICSICKEKNEVSSKGIPSSMSFYNFDKPGTISNGFNENLSWKNAPVCSECSLKLEAGWQLLNQALKFRFAGIPYLLLPKSIKGEHKSIDLLMRRMNSLISDLDQNKIRTSHLESISENEAYVIDQLIEIEDTITFSFIFFEKSSAAFYLNKIIQDVPPSRFTKLNKAKYEADHLLKKLMNCDIKDKAPILFGFSILKFFTANTQQFLNITDKIFKNQKINYQLLITNIANKIRENWKDEDIQKFTYNTSLKGLSLIFDLKNLGLLQITTLNINQIDMNDPSNNQINSFFADLLVFDTSSKRAVFLLGVLVQNLLNIQYKQRGSSPFKKQLKGLRLSQYAMQELFTKTINKLNEYEANYYKKLEEAISMKFVQTSKVWPESVDELNYFLVLGMSLSNYVNKNYFKIDSNNESQSN